ncbi:MAG: hypothetical protein JRI23_08265, partial [Deltaproteobacteria bacterium]|nr:hypothetical protein [Deltaproteobacteria bacterium]MBW2531607.1 hypothetical protein [Deltaproteobacteria bacterium]
MAGPDDDRTAGPPETEQPPHSPWLDAPRVAAASASSIADTRRDLGRKVVEQLTVVLLVVCVAAVLAAAGPTVVRGCSPEPATGAR